MMLKKKKEYSCGPPEEHVREQIPSEDSVWVLKKMLYGRRKAPAGWQKLVSELLTKHDLAQSLHDPTVYGCTRRSLYVSFHVDDIHFTGPDSEIDELVNMLASHLLLKWSKKYNVGDSYEFLKGHRLRTKSWIFDPFLYR